MRALVTGAAGFIGSVLVDRLLAEGAEVVGVDDLSRGSLRNLTTAREAGGLSFLRFDVTDPALTELVAKERPDAVFHLAAQIDVRRSVADPVVDARVNVVGTVNVLEAARRAQVGKVVFTSSGGSIYGDPSRLPVTERAGLDPRSPYAAGKAAAEFYLDTFRALYALPSTALALGNVFGPRQDPDGEAGVVAIFAQRLLEGTGTTIFGDGSATRDYVYVDDVVDAFVRAAGERGNGRRFNIGTGRATSVRELHRLIAAAVGAPDRPEFAPPRAGELHAIALDATAARRGLGWEPFTPLETGIQRTVDRIRQERGR